MIVGGFKTIELEQWHWNFDTEMKTWDEKETLSSKHLSTRQLTLANVSYDNWHLPALVMKADISQC